MQTDETFEVATLVALNCFSIVWTTPAPVAAAHRNSSESTQFP